MIDFIRFDFDRSIDLGFEKFVVFGEETERNVQGCLIYAESTKELREKLRKAKGLIGVMSPFEEVNKYAVMRKKVDILLDFPERRIDYVTVKLAKEKDVLIELSLSSILSTKGVKRVKIVDELRILFKVIKKFDTPFILTSGARDLYQLRHKRQIYDVFSYLNADVKRAEHWAKRLYRRLFDEKYIMNGLEIL